MNRQREAAEQVSAIEDIPDNTTEGQVDGGQEEGTEDLSRSPMQGEKVQPNGNVWSWSPFQSGMSSHHLHSGWSWSPITNVQHKYCGRWSWSPSKLKILPYATQEQSESDVQGQPSLTDVNCWPVFIDTYRPKRKRTRKRRRSKKFGPYRYKRERNWKTLTCVTGPTQDTESQVSPNAIQCDSYSCVSKMTLSTSQTQRVSSIWPQREINNSCLRSTGVDGARERSTSPAQESKAERNITASLQNSNEMSSKSSLSVLESSKMNEHPGVWQESVIDTQKKSEEQTLPSIFQVDEEQKLINNPSLNYEHNKSEGIRNKTNISVSKMEEKSGTLQKISQSQSKEDGMNDVDAISSSKYNADQAENLHASTLEADKVNNLPKTLTSQSKIVAADVSTAEVNDSSLPHDSVEIIERHENKLRYTFTPALDELEEKKVLETAEKRQTYESEMEGFKKTKSSLPEVEKGNTPQSQKLSPSHETDKRNSSINDGNNLFNTKTNTIDNKNELLCSNERGAEEENHSLSQIEFNNSRQICNSRSPSPVDKLISGGLKYSLSFELLDMSGGMAINTDSSRICKQVQSSTTGLSDDPSSQHSTSISPNEENANQVYSSDSYPGSFSSVNCDNLKHEASLLNEKKSSTTFSGCPSVKEDSIVLDGAVENISMKSCQAKEAANAMINCKNESSHSLIPENRCLENSIDNNTEEKKKKQNISSVNKNTSEPKCTLTRTRTLTLPYTETEKFSSVSISGTKSTIPVYERFEYGKTEDCKSLIEELELISKKSSSSSASNEKNVSVLQKDLPSPSRIVNSCHVKSQCSLLTNKDNGSDLEADTSEATSLLQKNMISTLDSDLVIAETEGFSASPQNEVKYSTMQFMSAEPKSPSTTKGFSLHGSKSSSPAEKLSSCKFRSSSPDERSVPCESNSPFPAQGPWESNSPSVAKGVSLKKSPAKGPLLEETRNPFLAETLTETVSSSSLVERPLPCRSKSPSSVKASSPQGSRSPSSIKGSSPWRSKSAPDEGSLLRKSRSPFLAEDFSPQRSRSPYPVKEISLWESRSPFLLVEGLSPQGSRSPSPAEGLSPKGSRSPSPAEGLSPKESRSPSPAKGLLPRGSRSPSPAEGLSPKGSRSPSPAEGLSPKGSRSPSPAEGLSPKGSRSPSPAEGLSPKESRSPSPAEGLSPKGSRSPSPAEGLSPKGSRSPSPAEGLSPKGSRSPSPAEGLSPKGSRSPSPAEGLSPKESRSPSPAEGLSPKGSRSPSPAEGLSPKGSRSPSPAEGLSPKGSRSPSPAEGLSPKESRSPSPAEGLSPKESRSPSPAEGLIFHEFRNPFPDKILLPQEPKSSSPAEGLSLSRNSSSVEGSIPNGSKSPSHALGFSPRKSMSPSPATESFLVDPRGPSPVEGFSPKKYKSPSPAKESLPMEPRSPCPVEGSSNKEFRSSPPVKGTSQKESRSPSSSERLSLWGSKILSPVLWGSKSPLPVKGPSVRVSKSSSSVKGAILGRSRSLSPVKGSSLQESKRQSLLKESSHQRCMSTMPDERPSLQRSSSSPAGKLSLRVSRCLSLTEGHITQGLKSPSHVEELSTSGFKSPPLAEEPSPQRSRSQSPNKGLSLTMSKSLATNERPSLVGPRNPYLPDFKSLQLVDNRAITLHSKDEASNVWCKVSSQYFHPNDKTRTPPPLSETVNIQVDITCTVEASGFQEVITTTPPSGVKRKHSECSVEEITIDNSQQRKKIATDPTETLNAILRKIHGKSILEFSTSHKTACRKSIVTRAVTRRLAHRSPNHDLHHVASARMEIFEAVESGDFEKVQELMQDTGPAVKRKDTHCTLLHEAVNHRQVDMVLFFLKYISPNVVNKEGSTPAHLAARKGYTQILRLLLADSEVDPNKRDLFNNTYKNWLTLPLLEAVVGDNRARIQELLRLGADPDHSAKPPEDWFADRNMEITTARQLAHALQRDNVLPLFKRKSVEDDLESVEDDDVNKALPELLFPKKTKDMDNEFMQLVDTSVAVARGPDVYRMDATPRGYVCILSYGSFHDRPDLHLQGSQTDAHNLANTFSKMGYRGHAHFSLTAAQTRQQLAKVRDMELLQRAGCAVFIISSHGEPRRHFLTSDMQTIDIQWVLDFFKDSQCPYLKNKPKLFIWDLCRGHQEQESSRGKTHGELCGRVDEPLRDVMCLDSSSGGFTWHAFSEEGTPFIGALCSVVARHAATKELTELYREFLKEYATAAPDAVPQLTNYGFNKKFYI